MHARAAVHNIPFHCLGEWWKSHARKLSSLAPTQRATHLVIILPIERGHISFVSLGALPLTNRFRPMRGRALVSRNDWATGSRACRRYDLYDHWPRSYSFLPLTHFNQPQQTPPVFPSFTTYIRLSWRECRTRKGSAQTKPSYKIIRETQGRRRRARREVKSNTTTGSTGNPRYEESIS